METKSQAVTSEYIASHVGYWSKIEKIRCELYGITPVYRSDEDLLDSFGLSKEYLRRIKAKARNKLEHHEKKLQDQLS